jgi:hypothetical protein
MNDGHNPARARDIIRELSSLCIRLYSIQVWCDTMYDGYDEYPNDTGIDHVDMVKKAINSINYNSIITSIHDARCILGSIEDSLKGDI